MLYVPRGWWHAVAATQGWSLHMTCGLTPATGHHLLVWLAGSSSTPPPCARTCPRWPAPPSAPPMPSSCAGRCPRRSTRTSSRSSP
ncbi:JmjC domain-containing protein [Streptomyces sp. NPDC057686]|uniref:JmjC domain-containing protein n=1 Tax=Streptomyces sp. NPDC057686 TaxID=3346212 RepID=UPI003689F39A